jgi:PHD/YefM family antitoxin component YafN of YafNO toxin-antitoxin module
MNTMTTKFIGLKEFRQNIASYTKEAKVKNIRFIILKKNVPVLEVKSLDEKEFTLEKLAAEIAEAREQVKKGKVYTEQQVYKMLGL